jgi:hypothetical protein
MAARSVASERCQYVNSAATVAAKARAATTQATPPPAGCGRGSTRHRAGRTKYGLLAGALSWKKCRIRFKPVM